MKQHRDGLTILQCAIQSMSPFLTTITYPLKWLFDADSSKFTGCLARKGYDETKCKEAVSALYKCCDAFYKDRGRDAVSASCPKPEVLRRQMENPGNQQPDRASREGRP
jgi:hypothetical protein